MNAKEAMRRTQAARVRSSAKVVIATVIATADEAIVAAVSRGRDEIELILPDDLLVENFERVRAGVRKCFRDRGYTTHNRLVKGLEGRINDCMVISWK